MTYFIHKTASGVAPQSGYTRVSITRYNGIIWVLWSTTKSAAEVVAEIKGDLKIIGVVPDSEILEVYPDIIAQKRAKIRAEGGRQLTEIAGEYSAEERETWEQQRQEADAYARDGELAETPMLSAFAAGRGIPVAMLAAGILENAALFKGASGVVMGNMYALLDQVTAAPDLNTALQVEW